MAGIPRFSGDSPPRSLTAAAMRGAALILTLALSYPPLNQVPAQTATITTPKRVRCLAFSPDGATIATGDGFHVVRTWDAKTLRPTGEFRGHKAPILAVAYSKDGRRLASGGPDPRAIVWDIGTRGIVASLEHRPSVTALDFSKDGRWLATGEGFPGCRARVWDASTLEPARVFPVGQDPSGVNNLAFSPDGRLLATSGDVQGDTWIWDLDKGVRTHILRGREEEGLTHMEFSPDGKTLAVLNVAHRIVLWDLASSAPTAIDAGFAAMAFTHAPDGKHLLVVGGATPPVESPGYFKFFHLPDGRQVAARTLDARGMGCVAFAPDGDTFAMGSVYGDTGLIVGSLAEVLRNPGESPGRKPSP